MPFDGFVFIAFEMWGY